MDVKAAYCGRMGQSQPYTLTGHAPFLAQPHMTFSAMPMLFPPLVKGGEGDVPGDTSG